jgi:hypothetical protein
MRCPDLPKVLFRIDYRWSAGDIELTRKYAAELRTLRMGRAMSETDRTQVSDRIGTVSLPAMRASHALDRKRAHPIASGIDLLTYCCTACDAFLVLPIDSPTNANFGAAI